MALIKCKECGNSISKSAQSCPKCGAKIKRTSLFTKIFGVLLFLIFSAIFLGVEEVEKYSKEQREQNIVQEQAENKRLASLSPEQREAEERQKEETKKAKEEGDKRRLGIKWNYQVSEDPMGRGKIKNAVLSSVNQVEFQFPYAGAQRGTIQLRLHPKLGQDAILFVQRGQFKCSSINRCLISVKFGDKKPLSFEALEPSDGSTNYLFVKDSKRFIAGMKNEDRLLVEVEFFQEGNRVFEFDVSGLQWE